MWRLGEKGYDDGAVWYFSPGAAEQPYVILPTYCEVTRLPCLSKVL